MNKIPNNQDTRYKQIPKSKIQNPKLVIGYWLLVIIWLLYLGNWSFADEITITKIESTRSLGIDYVDIFTTGFVKAKGLLLEDKLVIELPDSKIKKDIEISMWKSKRIKDISAKQLDDKTAQITVTFKKDIDYEIINVFGRNKSVVEICDRVDLAARIMAAWEKADLKEKSEDLKPYKYKADTKSKDQSLRGKIIVIDPGHGGRDPGAFSVSGIPEKTLNLQTARKAAYLLRLAGATVYLTRNADRKCGIKDIVDFANRVKADIFISIHYNYCGIQSISGTETYYYTRRSRYLALTLHRSLISGIKRKDRGLRREMLYICHHTNMPSVLIEPVYISNPKEDALAKKPSFQKEVAEDIVRGVKAYFRSTGS